MGSEVKATGLRNWMESEFAVVNKKLNHNSYKIFIHLGRGEMKPDI